MWGAGGNASGPKAHPFAQRRAQPWRDVTPPNIPSSAQRTNRSPQDESLGRWPETSMWRDNLYQGVALHWEN